MPDQYEVICPCGESIAVQLFEAGTSKSCPACGESVPVPNVNKLKESTGDKYPLLSPINKIEKMLAEREPPFDGKCQSCRKIESDWKIPLNFQYLLEREIIGDDRGFRVTLTGIKANVAKSYEHLESTQFPLLLCENCFAQFQQSQSKHRMDQIAISLCVALLLAGFMTYAYLEGNLTLILVGIGCVFGSLALKYYLRSTTPVDRFLIPWLSNIRWSMEAINEQMECSLRAGEPVRICNTDRS